MDIHIITEKITLAELRKAAKENFDDMIKAAVDIERGVMALGGELHADANEKLLEAGSSQKDIWGINIYPDRSRDAWIEYTSLINVRPGVNRSMEVQDPALRKKIAEIIDQLVP